MAGQLIFQPPTFHWPSEDQQMAYEEWRSHVTLALEASNVPQDRWYASIIGFLGMEGFKRWTHLDISKDIERKEESRERLPSLHKHSRSVNVPVELHRWNVQRHTTGRPRNHWPARPTHQDTGRKVRLSKQRGEGKTLTRATVSCD